MATYQLKGMLWFELFKVFVNTISIAYVWVDVKNLVSGEIV